MTTRTKVHRAMDRFMAHCRSADRARTMRPIPTLIVAAVASLGLAAPAAAADGPPTYQECLAEQATNLNVDCVTAAQVGPKPRKARTPRTVRVEWSLGGCAGFPATAWQWHVRILRDNRLGTWIPAEAPDGTRRYLFGGTTQAGSHEIKLRRGAYVVDLAVEHAYSPDGGDCGGVDVRSTRFVVR